ncbi:MAG: DMT family transporter [Xanthobacteraceae bacterium]
MAGVSKLRNSASPRPDVASARLMLVGVTLAWGLTWPALKMALEEIPPFSMRVGTCVIGGSALLGLGLLQGRDVRICPGRARIHIVIAGCLNVGALALLTAFAQLATSTARVAVLTYTMPIWAAVFARMALGERMTAIRAVSLLLCLLGLCVLLYPLLATTHATGVLLALATAVSWAAGTVYLKWARIEAEPLALAGWQLMVALGLSLVGLVLVEGSLHLWPVHPKALIALVFSGLAGSAIAYLLWFEIVRRLPATTASLGILGSPVVGVIGSVLVLGERLSVTDVIGFALVLTAAACVLLAPTSLVENG